MSRCVALLLMEQEGPLSQIHKRRRLDHVEKSALDYSRVVDQHEQIRGSAVDETGGASVSDPQMEKAFYLHRKDFGALLR
eukprot:3949910-Ditylum_brightwellii.AAC.1